MISNLMKIFIVFCTFLVFFGCANKKTQEDIFFILPEHEDYINFLAFPEKGEGHNHAEYAVPTSGGFHDVYCMTCGEFLFTAEHKTFYVEKNISYRGKTRYHVFKKHCICGIMYEREYRACLSDNTNCYCYNEELK